MRFVRPLFVVLLVLSLPRLTAPQTLQHIQVLEVILKTYDVTRMETLVYPRMTWPSCAKYSIPRTRKGWNPSMNSPGAIKILAANGESRLVRARVRRLLFSKTFNRFWLVPKRSLTPKKSKS
jgi:hypothetical protein